MWYPKKNNLIIHEWHTTCRYCSKASYFIINPVRFLLFPFCWGSVMLKHFPQHSAAKVQNQHLDLVQSHHTPSFAKYPRHSLPVLRQHLSTALQVNVVHWLATALCYRLCLNISASICDIIQHLWCLKYLYCPNRFPIDLWLEEGSFIKTAMMTKSHKYTRFSNYLECLRWKLWREEKNVQIQFLKYQEQTMNTHIKVNDLCSNLIQLLLNIVEMSFTHVFHCHIICGEAEWSHSTRIKRKVEMDVILYLIWDEAQQHLHKF